MLMDRLGLSERRACQITGQHRSTQRRGDPLVGADDGLRARLRRISTEHPRWGYRTAWGLLRGEGMVVNRKKIQRLWREEGLRVPPKRRKRRRAGTSTAPAGLLRAEAINDVWALDFQFDTTSDGRTLKLLHIVDEHSREALEILVERVIDADMVVCVLDRLAARHGPPVFIRMDNGPEMTANARSATGAWPAGRTPSTSSPAHPGRTRSSSRSEAASATRSSQSRRSPHSSRRRSSSRTGESCTTRSDPTRAPGGCRQASTPTPAGGAYRPRFNNKLS